MSSFVDRWLMSSKTTHNTGTKLANTGSHYSSTGLQSSQGNYPESEWATQKKTGTSPNLRNVPWKYYKDKEMAGNTDQAGSIGMNEHGPIDGHGIGQDVARRRDSECSVNSENDV